MSVAFATPRLPAQFADLEGFAARWAVATTSARHDLRLRSTARERQEFYDAAAPRVVEIVSYLDGFGNLDLPPDALALLRLVLALAQVALAVENYGPQEAVLAESAARIRIHRELDGI